MECLRRLWHRLLFGSSPLTTQPRPTARPAAVRPGPARPAASASPFSAEEIATLNWLAGRMPQPPRFVARSRDEVELLLLLAWLPEAERRRFMDVLVPRAGKQDPWAFDDLKGELWEQVQRWQEPLVITEPETMTREGFCNLLEAQFKSGLYTYCTPLDLLSRPVRMLWLLRQGRLVGQVYAAMEQVVGSAQALDAAWWVVAGL